jgi:Domain of unknown function (DUF4432)
MMDYWKDKPASLLRRVGSMDQLAPVRRVALLEGRSKSVEAIEVDTGAGLSFTVLIDRALDLADTRWLGRSLCWRSAAGVVAPAYYDRQGTGWLRGFGGGMLVTCGMRNVGPSLQEDGESFGLHGEISNSPATSVSSRTYWKEDRYCIEIQGEIREAYPFGPNLVLRRTWRTELGAAWVELEDVVTNEGFRPELHMLLYHWNFGFPLITERTKLELTTDLTIGVDEVAARGLSRWSTFEAPTAAFAEEVFYHSYSSQPPEITRARIASAAEDPELTVELSYPSRQLPELSQWKCCRTGEYVLGIEPGNCRPEGRAMHRSRTGRSLAPGESAQFNMRVRVL